ncbi:MAG: hypothetical protein ACRBN8_13000 [Nannocystales bacterium]
MQRELRAAAGLAAALLIILCSVTATTGVSQQSFELVRAPDVYAQALVNASFWLRTLIAIDDLFVAAYVTTTVLLVMQLAPARMTPLHWLVAGLGVAAAVLDLAENHHLLALLRWANAGQAIPADEILRRSELSQLKWMLGHTAFVGIGVLLPRAGGPVRDVFRMSLLFAQLPIGALAWAVDDATWGAVLTWARYGSFVTGFAVIGWLAHVGFGEAATGARE